MSLYPPPPPQYPPATPPPPGYGAPPTGYPMPGQSKGNGWAVTSLICGIIGCFALTSIAAIIFGALGIRKANREPQAGGKGLAIGGIALGAVWLLFFGFFGGALIAVMSGTSAQREVARSFVKAASAGDVATAQKYVTADIPPQDVATLVAQAKGWGTLNDTTAVGVSANAKNGNSINVVVIQAQYSNGIKQFNCEMVKEGDTWKIRKYQVQ